MLRFYAREGHVCPWPGQRTSGQLRQYIGRRNKIERDAKGNPTLIGHPATEEVVEIDPSTKDGKRVLRLMRIEHDKPLWPADESTAQACGVAFVKPEFSDGEWRAPKPSAPKRQNSDKKDGDK